MADNVDLPSSDGLGAKVATDQKTGTLEHYQINKLAFGALDTFNLVTSISTNPFPVALSATDNAVLDVIAADTTSLDGKTVACDTGAVVIASGTVSTVTNLSKLGGVAIAMGTGVRSAGTQRVTIATDDVVPVTNAGLTELAAAINANQMDVNIAAQSGAVTISDGGGSVTVDGTITTVSTVTNLAQLGGAAVSMNVGIQDGGTQRVTIATDDVVAISNTPLTNLDGAIAGTEVQVDVVAPLPAGTALIGKVSIDQATANANEVVTKTGSLVGLEAGTASIGKLKTVPSLHANAGTSTLTQIKATAGQIHFLFAVNLKATVLYLQVFSKPSASVTLGTDIADLVFPIPTQGNTNGGGFTLPLTNGLEIGGTGISYAITTTPTGNTAAASNEAFLNAGYE